MAEYYNMVLNEDELHWFFDHIIEKPLEYETYMVLLACRGKRLTEEEKEYTKVGSRGEMMHEDLIRCRGGLKQEWNFDIYKQAFYRYNCDKRSLLTSAYVPYPEHALVVYSVINPSSEIDCIEDTFERYNSERKNLTAAILKGSKVGIKDHLVKMPKVFEHMKSCHADHCSRRIWLDFDMDIKAEMRTEEVFSTCYEALHTAGLELFGKGNVAIIKTSGGYHTLVKKSALKHNPAEFIEKVIEKGKKLNPDFETFFAEFIQTTVRQKLQPEIMFESVRPSSQLQAAASMTVIRLLLIKKIFRKQQPSPPAKTKLSPDWSCGGAVPCGAGDGGALTPEQRKAGFLMFFIAV